jgi:hypothetical protein
MLSRKNFGLSLLLCASFAPVLTPFANAQDDHARGRKYKAPPETSHIVVDVTKASNGKVIVNAAVIFHPTKDGKDEGNLEVKTDPEGKATIDVIPIGSTVTVQVIANGFATFAQDYTIEGAQKQIDIKMIKPRAQMSAYTDNAGKDATVKPGVQEPNRPSQQQNGNPTTPNNNTPQ